MAQKYLAVNISFLDGLFANKREAINNMIMHGIYRYSCNLKVNLRDAINACAYEYLNDKPLPTAIKKNFREVFLNRDECFCDGEFSVPYRVYAQFMEDDNTELIEYARMITAAKNMCMRIGNVPEFIKACKKLNPTSPIVAMINTSKLYEFRDSEKREIELMQFSCYIAVKSILGRNKYAKTNIQYVLSRALPDVEDEAQNALREKYSTRRKFDSIMNALEWNWGIKKYSYFMRGFYLGDSKISLEDLAIIAEKSKQTNKQKELKNKKQSARELALKKINYLYS